MQTDREVRAESSHCLYGCLILLAAAAGLLAAIMGAR